jgi:hypothetical protein
VALQPLDAVSTTDFYELCVERHPRAATVVTSNRTLGEWLSVMADPLLAQSAVDRLVSTALEPSSKDPPTANTRNHQSTATPLACPLTTRKELA